MSHSDTESFQFIFEDKELDEGELHQFEVLSILKGNLDPLQFYQDKIAYKNLDYKLVTIDTDPVSAAQVGKLLRI